jgi:hypothetical protein
MPPVWLVNLVNHMWQKLKEQLPAVIITVILIGGLSALYVNSVVIPGLEDSQKKQMDELNAQHAQEIKDAADKSSREIEAVNQMLKTAIADRQADMFRTEDELKKLDADRMDALAAVIAKKIEPYGPKPTSPEDAERIQNEQVDKVSSRMADKIKPTLEQLASDLNSNQHLTLDQITQLVKGYSETISNQVGYVLTAEMAKNQTLNKDVLDTQGAARDSLALSREVIAIYLSSDKEQGALTRILALPANVIKDAMDFSILSSSERKKKETELLNRMNDLQKRLDDAQAAVPAK